MRRVCTPVRTPGAFTLVELLVAAGITVALAGFLAIVVRNVGITWSRAGGRLGADAQARFVLDQLEQDLQGAFFRDDGKVWLALDVLDHTNNSGLWQPAPVHAKPAGPGLHGSLHLAPSAMGDARFGQAGVWLRFFTTRRGTNDDSTAATVSAPVAVGYQIIRRYVSPHPGNPEAAYLLHRAEARPAEEMVAGQPRPGVIESGFDLANPAYGTPVAGNDGSVTGDPCGVRVPGGERNLDAVIADHVIDFGVRCYVRERVPAGGLRLIFPVDATGTLTNRSDARFRATLPSRTPPEHWGQELPMPDVIDVMLRVLTNEGAALLARLEGSSQSILRSPPKYEGNPDAWWWGVALAHSHVYTLRIVLNRNLD